jgi:conjugal transfer pilus assembly protein TraF
LLDSFLGVCLTKKKVYCCFESKLSRILQEQGRQQLNKPWGKPKTEQCLGFTIDEFARLDLSPMDFSEVYAEFTDAARLPDELQAATEIQQKIEDYYARAANKAARRLLPPASSLTAACARAQCPASGRNRPRSRPATARTAFYCEERRLGYWFYCTRPKPPEAGGDIRACRCECDGQLDADHGELRELKAKAILEPTPANVTAYIRFQREQLDRASLFSDVWQRAIWQDPDLDYTLERPVSTLGKRQWQDARNAERNARHGATLGERYGLFYFFAQSCGACEVMSPIVQAVADLAHHGARDFDRRRSSRHFPNYTVETNQRSRAWGLSPRSRRRWCCGTAAKGRAIPIGYGVMSPTNCRTAFTSSHRRKPDVTTRMRKRAALAILAATLPLAPALHADVGRRWTRS